MMTYNFPFRILRTSYPGKGTNVCRCQIKSDTAIGSRLAYLFFIGEVALIRCDVRSILCDVSKSLRHHAKQNAIRRLQVTNRLFATNPIKDETHLSLIAYLRKRQLPRMSTVLSVKITRLHFNYAEYQRGPATNKT
jgi:hypothetical protein